MYHVVTAIDTVRIEANGTIPMISSVVNDNTSLAWLQMSPLLRELETPAVMTSYSSMSRISIISAAVITCGSFGKCLRLPVTKKESSLLRQTS